MLTYTKVVSGESTASPLFLDPDPSFRRRMAADRLARRYPPVCVQSVAQLKVVLAGRRARLAAIFLSDSLQTAELADALAELHRRQPGAPIFLLGAASCEASEEQARLGVQWVLERPQSLGDFASRMEALLDRASSPTPWGDGSGSVGGSLEDQEFVPVHARAFAAGLPSAYDVYIRLKSGRFLKLLGKGDGFPPERIRSYLDKGIRYFHVSKDDQAELVARCEQRATELLASREAGLADKTSGVLAAGDAIARFLVDRGIGDQEVESALRFTEQVRSLVAQLKLERSDVVRQFLADAVEFEHGVATSTVAALLFRHLRVESHKLRSWIGVAALLHDIGKKRLPSQLFARDVGALTAEEMRLAQSHPIVGAEILRASKNLDPVVSTAVAQHHERRDGKGYPNRLGADRLGLFGQIIGLADEIVHAAQAGGDLDAILRPKIQSGFSTVVGEAYLRVFARKS